MNIGLALTIRAGQVMQTPSLQSAAGQLRGVESIAAMEAAASTCRPTCTIAAACSPSHCPHTPQSPFHSPCGRSRPWSSATLRMVEPLGTSMVVLLPSCTSSTLKDFDARAETEFLREGRAGTAARLAQGLAEQRVAAIILGSLLCKTRARRAVRSSVP